MNKEEIIIKLKETDAKNNVLKVKSDIRHSDLFAMMFMNELRFVPTRNCWYWYDGKRWVRDNGEVHANELCKVLAGCLLTYAGNIASQCDDTSCIGIAQKWQSRAYRDKIMRDAKTVCALDIADFDQHPYLLNLNNGTLDLNTGELLKHNPDDFITKLAPVDYVKGAKSDRWVRFINEIMSGDEDKARFLQGALGYSLSGNTNRECMYILYGESTRNGKGTLMESIINVMGDYGASVKPETISQARKSSGAPNEDIARLKGIRIANISEPPKNMPLNSALVKTLTGGDTINARFLHENSFDFKPEFKIFMNTNYLPSIDDSTVFASNRIYVIPFEHHFTKYEQDTSLKELFRTSDVKSAILWWLIEGYNDSSTSLEVPQAVYEAVREYSKTADDVFRFLEEVLCEEAGAKMIMGDVYKYYYDWCIYNHLELLPRKSFSRKLSQYGRIKNCRVYGQQFKCLIGFKHNKCDTNDTI